VNGRGWSQGWRGGTSTPTPSREPSTRCKTQSIYTYMYRFRGCSFNTQGWNSSTPSTPPTVWSEPGVCPACGWPLDTVGHEVNCCEEDR
jgi:hypothetical protein